MCLEFLNIGESIAMSLLTEIQGLCDIFELDDSTFLALDNLHHLDMKYFVETLSATASKILMNILSGCGGWQISQDYTNPSVCCMV